MEKLILERTTLLQDKTYHIDLKMRGNNNDGGREAFDDDQNILCQNPG